MNTNFCNIPVFQEEKESTIYQKDISNLLIFMQQFHPIPILDENRFEIIKVKAKELYDQYGTDRETKLSDFQANLNKWLALFEDAHSLVMLEDKDLYPYTMRYYNGDFFFHTLSSAYPNCTGKKIVSINGLQIKDLIQKLDSCIPSENKIKAGITGSFFMNHKAFLNLLGIDTHSELEFTFGDGSEIKIKTANQNVAQNNHVVKVDKHPITAREENAFHYKIVNNKCYFQFNTIIDRFSYEEGCRFMEIEPDTQILQSLPKFCDFLEEMSNDMKCKNITTLVVDLRYNGGGNSLLGDILLKFLGVEIEKIHQYTTYTRYSDFLESCYPVLFRQINKECNIGSLINQKELGIDSVKLPELKYSFEGKVYFIQGQNTFSSANYLLTLIKDNALFPIIGTPTSQKPSCFGDVLPIQLPFTKTKGYISFAYFERPNKENSNNSLFPDILIETTLDDYLSGKDACWDYIIQHNP